MFNEPDDSAYRADLLTHRQARERLAGRPAVVMPLGGCEPFGAAGRTGVETLCAERTAGELARRGGALCAPPLPFGCSAPFAAFHGAAGVKPRTFVNMLCEIAGAYALQGAKRVLLVNAAPFSKAPAAEAAKRIEAKHGGAVKVLLFDINTIINTIINTNTEAGVDRADAGLLAMAAYLDGDGVSVNIDTADGVNINTADGVNINTADGVNINTASGINTADGVNINTADGVNTSGINIDRRRNASVDQYRAWRKRGADPQKLRKLFPDGLLIPRDSAAAIDITPERGKELFDRVVGVIAEGMGIEA